MKFLAPVFLGGCVYATGVTAEESAVPKEATSLEDTVNGVKTTLNFAGKYTQSCFSVPNSLCFGKAFAGHTANSVSLMSVFYSRDGASHDWEFRSRRSWSLADIRPPVFRRPKRERKPYAQDSTGGPTAQWCVDHCSILHLTRYCQRCLLGRGASAAFVKGASSKIKSSPSLESQDFTM